MKTISKYDLKKFPKSILLYPLENWDGDNLETGFLSWANTKTGKVAQKYLREDVVKKMINAAVMDKLEQIADFNESFRGGNP